jgi:outer membrane protein assembly factor BamB
VLIDEEGVMNERMRATVVIVAWCVCCVSAWGDDWPQWLGPQRDSIWRETGVVRVFPKEGLTVKWRVPIAGGYAGPAVADGKVYVTDYVRESGDSFNNASRRAELVGRERVTCQNAEDGSLVWRHEYRCPYRLSYPRGPRATPTVVDGKVYTLGAMGNLCCLDADTGRPVWSKDLKEEYKAETPMWGFTGHPLVDGRKLICLVGGRGSVAVALDKDTGDELWRSLSAREPGYCPPIMIEAGGTRQLIIFHAEAINGLNPETGEAYWSVALKPSYGMSIATPRKSGDYLFASGIGNEGALLKLDRAQPRAEVVWRGDGRTAVYCANSTPFIDDNVIYGVCHQGELRAVELRTGERLWQTYAPTTGVRRAACGTAFIVKHEDRYFLYSEQGDLILARLSRNGYEEISRFHVLEPTNEAMGRRVVWSHPAFANRSVYARNDQELVCVSLAAE